MNVFITGATGILGREIVRILMEGGFAVSALCRDSTSQRLTKVPGFEKIEWIEGDLGDLSALQMGIEKADFVVHAAALVSFLPSDQNKLYRANVEGTANVVNVCLTAKNLKRLIHISSVASLSPSKPMPVEIDERQGFNPDENTSDYARSKYNGELEVLRGVEEGLKAAMVNPSIILTGGAADESSASLFNYVRKERPFYPEGWINFVDVRDVAKVVKELILRGPDDGSKMILSAGHVPYLEFLTRSAQILGKKAPTIASRPWMTALAWRLEMFTAFFTRKKPLLTRFTAAASSKRFIFKGKALEQFWPDFSYHSLDETLQWILKK